MTIEKTGSDDNAADRTTSSSPLPRPNVLIGGKPSLFIHFEPEALIGSSAEIAWMTPTDPTAVRRAGTPDTLNELRELLLEHVVVATSSGTMRLRLTKLVHPLAEMLPISAMGVIDVAMAICTAARVDHHTLANRIAPAWGRALQPASPPVIVTRTAAIIQETLALVVEAACIRPSEILTVPLSRQVAKTVADVLP